MLLQIKESLQIKEMLQILETNQLKTNAFASKRNATANKNKQYKFYLGT